MTEERKHNLSDKELQILADLLGRLKPGFLPLEIFMQIARLVALPILEVVPLRLNGHRVEVMLLERSADDPIWPGMVHTPGTVIRATDTEQNIYLALERIRRDELNDTKISELHFVGSLLQKSRRGTEQAQIYWVEVLEALKTGAFYPVDELPGNLVESQPKFIAEAVRSFRQYKKLQD